MSDIPITIRDPEKIHLPIVILVDKSEAMRGPQISALNQSLMRFKEACKGLEKEDRVADICIIAFGGKGHNGIEPDIQILQPFVAASEMDYDTYTNPLTAEGVTPFANAMETGLEEISRINGTYQKNKIKYTVPSLICLVKGMPTDERYYYNSITESIKDNIENKCLDALCMCLGPTSPMMECIDIFGINSNGIPRVGLINDDGVVSKYNVVFNFIIGEICGPIKPLINGKSEYLISESKTLNEDVNTKINQYTKGNSETAITIKDPEKIHMPIILLVDKSEAMSGSPIDALNQSLMYFKELYSDLNTNDRVADICIIAFGGKGPNGDDPDIQILQPFASANEMSYDTITNPLIANGAAPLANAVKAGLYEIARIKMEYLKKKVHFNSPWFICIVKGVSTENKEFYNSVKDKLNDTIHYRHIFPMCFKLTYDTENLEDTWIPNLFGEEHEFRIPLINNALIIRKFFEESFETIKENFYETALQESIPTNIDLVYCIDATERMKDSIEQIKNSLLFLHEGIARSLFYEYNRTVQKLRIKVIVFRDLNHDNDKAIEESKFFQLPDETDEYEKYIDKIEACEGEGESYSALEALHIAINSNWVRQNVTDDTRRHIIILITETSLHALDDAKYWKNASKNLNELFEEWNRMDEFAKRLIIITSNLEPWIEINDMFSPCLLPVEGLNDEFTDQMFKFIAEKTRYH